MKKLEKKSSRTCSDKRQSMPVLRQPAKTRAGFQKGNQIGLATRFKPGQSGNAGGRPRSAKYTEALRHLLEMDIDDPIPSRSNAERLAKTVFKLATTGRKKLGAICEIADRAEGRPGTAASANGGTDPMAEILKDLGQVRVALYGEFNKPKGELKNGNTAAGDGEDVAGK